MADIKNSFYKNNNTLQAVGTAAAGIADTAFENPKFKRGLYDMADPLYYLAGNRESKVGNAMSDTGVELFKSGVSSGNPWLMLAGGISKGAGSLVNAAWGHGEDKDNINRNNSLIAKAQGINILDSSSDELMYSAGLSNLDSLKLDRSKFTNGWWNHDGTKAYNKAFGKMTLAQGYNDNKINNGVNNFALNQFGKAMANSNAYGGPIMGATDYSIMQDYITLKNKSLGDKTYNTSRVPTITAFASGGPLFSNGAMWDTGITFINNGGTHEANPYEGVQMGMDPQGVPNLVEEGEVVWNDYVFSNRLKVPKAFKEQYKLDKNADLTFADVAKKFSEEIEERPNDPISKAGRDALLTTLMDKQEEIRMAKEARKQAKQQALLEQAMPEMMAGNPYAMPQEMVMQESPEEYGNSNNTEMMMGNQSFAEGGQLGNLYKGPGKKSQKIKYGSSAWFARKAKELGVNFDLSNFDETDFNKNLDTFNDLYVAKQKERAKQVYINSKINEWKNLPDKFDKEGNLLAKGSAPTEKALIEDFEKIWDPANALRLEEKNNKQSWLEGLRYAPALGGLVGLTKDIFSSPDYSRAQSVIDAANRPIQNIDYKPIGDYLSYNPFDLNYATNQLRASSNATRRSLMNQNGPGRNAALLALDYNTGNQLGNLYRQAEEYNLEQRAKVGEFNRGTNMANAQGYLTATTSNQKTDLANQQSRLNGIITGNQMMDQIDAARNASMNANLTNFVNSLGYIGEEEFNKNQMYPLIGPVYKDPYKKRNGGMLTMRKKKGGNK